MNERRQIHKDEEGLFIVFGGNQYRPKYSSNLEESEFVLVKRSGDKSLNIRDETWVVAREDIIYRNKQGVM